MTNLKEGDRVNSGNIIAEVETDKATMEIETVDEGVVKKLLFKEGTESIKVNTPIAIIEDGSTQKETKEKRERNPYYTYLAPIDAKEKPRRGNVLTFIKETVTNDIINDIIIIIFNIEDTDSYYYNICH